LQDRWSARAEVKQHDLGKEVDKLVVITAARKKLQEQLGEAPTEEGYMDCGKRAGIGLVHNFVSFQTSC
jgi:hypothetical protein